MCKKRLFLTEKLRPQSHKYFFALDKLSDIAYLLNLLDFLKHKLLFFYSSVKNYSTYYSYFYICSCYFLQTLSLVILNLFAGLDTDYTGES